MATGVENGAQTSGASRSDSFTESFSSAFKKAYNEAAHKRDNPAGHVNVILNGNDPLFTNERPEILRCDTCVDRRIPDPQYVPVLDGIGSVLDQQVYQNNGNKLDHVVFDGHGSPENNAVIVQGAANSPKTYVPITTLADFAAQYIQPGGKLTFSACAVLRNDLPYGQRQGNIQYLQSIADQYGIEVHVPQSDISVKVDNNDVPTNYGQFSNGRYIIFKPNRPPERDFRVGDLIKNTEDVLKYDIPAMFGVGSR